MHRTWDIEKAVAHLNAHAKRQPTYQCARYVRQAIEAGGVTLTRHTSAADYGRSLVEVGFEPMTSGTTGNRAGDVVIFAAILPKHEYGHMAMFNGTCWVSDFVQKSFYVADAYRRHNKYTIYRHPVDTP